jgi:hypothetical protein
MGCARELRQKHAEPRPSSGCLTAPLRAKGVVRRQPRMEEGMSGSLRDEILLLLEEHARTHPHHYKGDKEIAERLGRSVGEVQRQMDILESQGLITPANSRNGNNALINPRGLLRVEELRESGGSIQMPGVFNPH